MIQALAPRMPRGFSWVLLAIVVIAWAPLTTQAQATDDKSKVEDKKPADKPEKEAIDDSPTSEVFTDPNAKKALGVFAPMNYVGPQIKVGNAPDDRSKAQSMAARTVNTDPDFLKNYVNFFTSELTRRDYLNALLTPPAPLKPNERPNDVLTRGLERAVDALTMPIIVARANKNNEFLDRYKSVLFDSSLPKVLENNYLTRIDAMIVLGMMGSPTNQALDLYIKELKKPDQVIWVKLWATRGLTNASQNGKVDLDATRSILAADALIGFLDSDPKLPWPAQMRALEALGSIRVATASLPRIKIDAASVAMRFLADPDARPEVRAWAAWALGMLKISPSVDKYNFSLIGYELGQLTVSIGEQIVSEVEDHPADFEREKVQAEHLTGLLLFQVYPALIGEEDVRASGLLKSPHPSFGLSKDFLTKLEVLVKGVTRESFELLKAGGGAINGKKDDLKGKIADLKSFLEKSSPKDRHLIPGGPEFKGPDGQQVVGAAGK